MLWAAGYKLFLRIIPDITFKVQKPLTLISFLLSKHSIPMFSPVQSKRPTGPKLKDKYRIGQKINMFPPGPHKFVSSKNTHLSDPEATIWCSLKTINEMSSSPWHLSWIRSVMSTYMLIGIKQSLCGYRAPVHSWGRHINGHVFKLTQFDDLLWNAQWLQGQKVSIFNSEKIREGDKLIFFKV